MDPYLCVASLFATWLRIRILFGIIGVWCIIQLGVSGAFYSSFSGSLANIQFPNGDIYNSFVSQICNSSPYMYMRPFAFNVMDSSGNISNNPSLCTFSSSLSDMRIVITVFAFCAILLFSVNTPLSYFARYFWVMFGIFFFTCFVLDANAVTLGTSSCQSNFANTQLNTDLQSLNLSLVCITEPLQVIVVIDFVLAFSFILLHTSWGLCKDLYVVKNGSNDNKTLLSSMA